jgi:uncharacterized repeat protein (TIGR02543 family)
MNDEKGWYDMKKHGMITALAALAVLLVLALVSALVACDFNAIKYELGLFLKETQPKTSPTPAVPTTPTGPSTYSVTYHADDATGGTPPDPQSVDKTWNAAQRTITLAPRNGLSREDEQCVYIFAGWHDPVENETYKAGDPLRVDRDIDLYAQWDEPLPGYFIVTYNGNGVPAPLQPPIPMNTSINLADPTAFTKTDEDPAEWIGEYTFEGWVEEGTGAVLQPGRPYTPTGNVTFTARWNLERKYTWVTYDSNGGGEVPMAEPAPEGIEYEPEDGKLKWKVNAEDKYASTMSRTIPLSDSGSLTDGDKVFYRWGTAQNGGGTLYKAGEEFTVTGPADFYASYKKQWTVTYNRNGGTAGIQPDPQTVFDGETIVVDNMYNGSILSQGQTAEQGGDTYLTFTGWNTAAGGEGTKYAAGALVRMTSDIYLYAQWEMMTTAYTWGDTGPAGGIIFYVNENYVNDGWRYLEAASNDLPGTYAWGGYGEDCLGTFTQDIINNNSGYWAGPRNTAILAACTHITTTRVKVGEHYEDGNGDRWTPPDNWNRAMPPGVHVVPDYEEVVVEGHPAAKACADYSYGGYNDWYLPDFSELDLMKSTGLFMWDREDIISGDDRWFNAREALDLKTDTREGSTDYYWSSTQYGRDASTSPTHAYYWGLWLDNKDTDFRGQTKETAYLVRPIRRF